MAMSVRFWKYHALGNDYLVVRSEDGGGGLVASVVRRLCDRHTGVGADGVLVWTRAAAAGCHLRIFNPDGSEAEKSGNGLRILARHLWDRGLVSAAPFAVSVAGRELRFSAVTIGNPHCVVPRDTISAGETRVLGPLIERDPRFPRRTNVQFLRVRDRHNIEIEIWERGAGYTLASGSSSCAAAAVAHRLGWCDDTLCVHMAGGTLSVALSADGAVRMRGPAEPILEGVLSCQWAVREA